MIGTLIRFLIKGVLESLGRTLYRFFKGWPRVQKELSEGFRRAL